MLCDSTLDAGCRRSRVRTFGEPWHSGRLGNPAKRSAVVRLQGTATARRIEDFCPAFATPCWSCARSDTPIAFEVHQWKQNFAFVLPCTLSVFVVEREYRVTQLSSSSHQLQSAILRLSNYIVLLATVNSAYIVAQQTIVRQHGSGQSVRVPIKKPTQRNCSVSSQSKTYYSIQWSEEKVVNCHH